MNEDLSCKMVKTKCINVYCKAVLLYCVLTPRGGGGGLGPQLGADALTRDWWKAPKQCVRVSVKTTLFTVVSGKLPLFTALVILTTLNNECFFHYDLKTDPFLQNLYFSYPKRRQYCTKLSSENKSFSYQDTLPLRSLLICIFYFDNKTSKIFSKCNHLFGRNTFCT